MRAARVETDARLERKGVYVRHEHPSGSFRGHILKWDFGYIGLTHCCAIQLRHEEAISVEPLEGCFSYYLRIAFAIVHNYGSFRYPMLVFAGP